MSHLIHTYKKHILTPNSYKYRWLYYKYKYLQNIIPSLQMYYISLIHYITTYKKKKKQKSIHIRQHKTKSISLFPTVIQTIACYNSRNDLFIKQKLLIQLVYFSSLSFEEKNTKKKIHQGIEYYIYFKRWYNCEIKINQQQFFLL